MSRNRRPNFRAPDRGSIPIASAVHPALDGFRRQTVQLGGYSPSVPPFFRRSGCHPVSGETKRSSLVACLPLEP